MQDDVGGAPGNDAREHDNALALTLADEAATLALGAALAPILRPGLRILLEGDLGAGKTTLVRGLLRALGYAGKVKSPTYTLVELYAISGLNLYHFDFYRLERPEEYLEAGLDEYFHGNAICLVEWPARAGNYLPEADLGIRLSLIGSGRYAEIQALGTRGLECLQWLRKSSSLAAICSNSPPR